MAPFEYPRENRRQIPPQPPLPTHVSALRLYSLPRRKNRPVHPTALHSAPACPSPVATFTFGYAHLTHPFAQYPTSLARYLDVDMHSSGSGLGLVPHGGHAGSGSFGAGAGFDSSIPIAQRRAVTGFFAGSEWGALLLTTNAAANIQLYQIDPQSFTLIKIAECYLGANIQGLERLRIGTNPKGLLIRPFQL
ncbi:hypothetical protein BCR44DRAFT_55798 [Catenaria anguillulae PL171]|uniref:Uncharacterized protein n=1 Tax=Catenaria anguillulae PL171 TaxID=765915 RepID=A0A1Y2HZ08_9FUNG|nr:hypothetical protein BCR44DRAFT_55798 [Catenaria anguillulae PL171]